MNDLAMTLSSVLDLKGPQFLGFYVVAVIVAGLLAALAYSLLRGPFDDPPPRFRDLTPLEIAFLSGGPQRVADAAIAGLLQTGDLEPGLVARSFARKVAKLSGRRSAVECAVIDAATNTGTPFDFLRAAGTAAAERQGDRLRALGLVLPDDRRLIGGLAMIAPMLFVFVVGAIKVGIGLSRGRPVEFLFIFLIATAVLAVLLWAARPLRTARGERALAKLRSENAALGATAHATGSRGLLSGSDVALAFALFGMAALQGDVLGRLAVALMPRASSGGSSCGSSCGGGCGGGCGGCGS